MTAEIYEHTSANNSATDPTKAANLALQIVGILATEDSVTRHRAVQAAMTLLGESTPLQGDRPISLLEVRADRGDEADLAGFFNREENLKPSDNVHLCAAFHYSVYGPCSFAVLELKAIAADAGIVLPDRVDMTLRSATQKGKKLFQPAGHGLFKPTAAGGLYFLDKWKVKPGRKAKPSETKGKSGAED